MYLTQVIKTSILVPGKCSEHNVLHVTGEKNMISNCRHYLLLSTFYNVILQSLFIFFLTLLSDPRGVVSRWPPAFY